MATVSRVKESEYLMVSPIPNESKGGLHFVIEGLGLSLRYESSYFEKPSLTDDQQSFRKLLRPVKALFYELSTAVMDSEEQRAFGQVSPHLHPDPLMLGLDIIMEPSSKSEGLYDNALTLTLLFANLYLENRMDPDDELALQGVSISVNGNLSARCKEILKDKTTDDGRIEFLISEIKPFLERIFDPTKILYHNSCDQLRCRYYVPSFVSEKVKEIWEGFKPPVGNAPTTMELSKWQEVQAGLEEFFTPMNEKICETYKPEIIETSLDGVDVLDIRPKGGYNPKKVLLCAHGGGYWLFSPRSSLISSVPVAEDTNHRVISIDYTLAPKANYEEITDQVIQVIEALMSEGININDISLYGDSAGRGLMAGAILKMREQGKDLPGALILQSPWLDISNAGKKYPELSHGDPLPGYEDDSLEMVAHAYAPIEQHKNPIVSPLFGDFSKGFVRTLVQISSQEMFYPDAREFYEKLTKANVPAELVEFRGLWHVFQTFYPRLEESKSAREGMRRFLEAAPVTKKD